MDVLGFRRLGKIETDLVEVLSRIARDFFLVDSTDETRIDDARVVCNRMLANTDLQNAPVLIVANKIDESGPEGLTMVKTAFEHSALNSNSNDSTSKDGRTDGTTTTSLTKNGILDNTKKKKKKKRRRFGDADCEESDGCERVYRSRHKRGRRVDV